jgi:uncharacterized protein YdeI (YjbR/CyaY-like superfamily)
LDKSDHVAQAAQTHHWRGDCHLRANDESNNLKTESTEMNIEPVQTHAFARPADFGNWLAENHSKETEIWLKMHKKSSGLASVSWAEAVVEALAWGWIDGIKKANDGNSWLQRFTPRKPKSSWSKRNRDHAEKLIADGRMQAVGLQTVNAAKSDGRWESAYAGSSGMEFPKAFMTAIAKNAAAKKTFHGLNRAQLYSMYLRLQTAKKEETRQKFMKKVLEMLSRGEGFR